MNDLQEHVQKLKQNADHVAECAEDWVARVDDFEVDKYDANWQRDMIYKSRMELETALDHFTTFLAFFFDYLHTERRTLELETGKYFQSARDDRAKKISERAENDGNNREQEVQPKV